MKTVKDNTARVQVSMDTTHKVLEEPNLLIEKTAVRKEVPIHFLFHQKKLVRITKKRTLGNLQKSVDLALLDL